MAIQLPVANQNIAPLSGQVPLVPQQGQGAEKVAQGLDALSGAAQNIGNQEYQVQQAREAENRKFEEELQKQRDAQQQKDDVTDAMNADTTLQNMTRDSWVSNQQSRRGSAARGITKDQQDELQKNIKAIGAKLETPEAQRIFEEKAASFGNGHLNSVASFEAKESNAAFGDAAQATIASAVDNGSSNAGNPVSILSSRLAIQSATHDLATLNKWSDTELAVEMKKNLTTLHVQAIQNLASVDAVAARAYYAKWQDEIDGQQYDGIEKMLNVTDTRAAGDKVSDPVLQQVLDGKMTWEQGRADIRTKLTGEARAHALDNLYLAERDHNEETNLAYKGVKDIAYKQLYGDDGKSSPAIGHIHPDVWAKLTGEDQHTLRDIQDRPAKDPQTDIKTFEWLRHLQSFDPVAYSQIDLRDYQLKLSKTDYDKLQDNQDQINAGAAAGVRTETQDFENATSLMTDPAQKQMFNDAARDQLNALRLSQKSPVTADQRQQILKQLQSDITWKTKGTLYGENVHTVKDFIALSDPAKLIEVVKGLKFSDVPASFTGTIQRANPGISDDGVLRLYFKSLGFPVQ